MGPPSSGWALIPRIGDSTPFLAFLVGSLHARCSVLEAGLECHWFSYCHKAPEHHQFAQYSILLVCHFGQSSLAISFVTRMEHHSFRSWKWGQTNRFLHPANESKAFVVPKKVLCQQSFEKCNLAWLVLTFFLWFWIAYLKLTNCCLCSSPWLDTEYMQ